MMKRATKLTLCSCFELTEKDSEAVKSNSIGSLTASSIENPWNELGEIPSVKRSTNKDFVSFCLIYANHIDKNDFDKLKKFLADYCDSYKKKWTFKFMQDISLIFVGGLFLLDVLLGRVKT